MHKVAEGTTPFADIVNKFGLPTAILIICGYFTYNDVVKPIAADYQKLLLEVRSNNTEIRKSLLELGEQNRKRIGAIEDQILKNSEIIATGIRDIAEQNKAELSRIEDKIDRILEVIDNG